MHATIAYDEMCNQRNIWWDAWHDATQHFDYVRAGRIRERYNDVHARLVGLYANRTQELQLVNLSPDTGGYAHDPRD